MAVYTAGRGNVMIFKISTVAVYYNDKDKIELEKIGFNFRKTEHSDYIRGSSWWCIKDDIPEICFNTLEKLSTFIKKYGDVIISITEANEGLIKIYDDYIE